MNPEQAALMSNAPQRSPSSAATVAEVPGTVRSGVVVASTTASSELGSSPDIPSARRPASAERPAVVPPTRRSRMPVRSTIHSSVVSRPISARSRLVSVFGGRAVPQPVMTAPLTSGPIFGMAVLLQLLRSQATGWRAVRRSVSTAM